MENMDLLNNDLQVSAASQNFLNEAAKWGKFLAIVGFIFCGIMIVVAFFIPTLFMTLPPYNQLSGSFSSGVSAGITVVYLVLALILFFPCLYLFRFSVKMKLALSSVSQENFDISLQNLKSLLKFYGIFTIVMLSFYALAFIVGMLGVAMR